MASEQFVIRLGMNSIGVSTGVNNAVGQVQRLFGKLQNVAVGIGIGSYIKQIISWAGHINDLSIQMGVSTETLQSWEYAAKQTGVSVEEVAKSYRDLQRAQIAAIKGDADAADAFKRIGKSVSDLRKLHPEALWVEVGKKFEALPASAQATVDAMKLLGKGGVGMLAAFRDGFASTSDSAKKLGLIVEDSVIKRLDSFGDKMSMIGQKMLASLAPAIGTLASLTDKLLTKIVSTVAGFAAYHGALSGGATSAEAEKAQFDAMKENEDQAKAAEDQLKKAIAESKKPKAPNETDTVGHEGKRADPVTDNLRRLGGYRGGSSNGELSRIPEMQLRAQQTANNHLARIASAVEKKSDTPTGDRMVGELNSLVRILTGAGE